MLFAGINGVGKTSLYNVIKDKTQMGIRVSIDDYAESLGDWTDPVVQVKASCTALKEAYLNIKKGISFNQETTLPGMVIAKELSEARKYGYTVVLYFVGVEGVDLAIERVHRRIENGGHGVPDELILKRYINMPKALSKILPLCHWAFFYDNTEMFRQIASIENGSISDLDPNLPEWFYIMTGRK